MRSALLTVLCLTFACPATYFMGRWGNLSLAPNRSLAVPSPVPATPGLFIDPAELNLGEMWEDPEYAATVSLRNTSDVSIAVSRFGTSCTCPGIEPEAVVLPAQGSVSLRMKMDLTYRLPHLSELERRPFSLSVYPQVLQAGVASNGWEFTGVIRSRVGLSDSRIEFGDRCTYAGPPVTRKVRATAFNGATLEAFVRPQASATVRLTAVAGKPGEYAIDITPAPKLPLGPFRFGVPITAIMPDGERHRCTAIEVSGAMQPSTRIVPDIVLLGEHSVGGEATAEVSVRFPESSGWAVGRFEPPPHTTVTLAGSSEDGSLSYRLVQKITEPGDRVEKVKFRIANPAGAWETVELTVRYYGVAATRR